MKKRHLIPALALAACFAAPAVAQEARPWYVGVSSGQSHFENVCSGVDPCDDRDTNGSIFAGYQFARYIAVEGAWRYFGNADIGASGAGVKANAIELDAVLTLPIWRSFSMLGRIGIFHANLQGTTNDETNNGATYGWGVQWDMVEGAALRLEWQKHPELGGGDFGAETDIDSINLGILFRF
ncbi:MAG TPA: outer membrane beta-barrel protein [Burkholderiales bacterium]